MNYDSYPKAIRVSHVCELARCVHVHKWSCCCCCSHAVPSFFLVAIRLSLPPPRLIGIDRRRRPRACKASMSIDPSRWEGVQSRRRRCCCLCCCVLSRDLDTQTVDGAGINVLFFSTFFFFFEQFQNRPKSLIHYQTTHLKR